MRNSLNIDGWHRLLAKGRSKMFKEFKDFAMKGNVVDMAVGIIIGAASVQS